MLEIAQTLNDLPLSRETFKFTLNGDHTNSFYDNIILSVLINEVIFDIVYIKNWFASYVGVQQKRPRELWH